MVRPSSQYMSGQIGREPITDRRNDKRKYGEVNLGAYPQSSPTPQAVTDEQRNNNCFCLCLDLFWVNFARELRTCAIVAREACAITAHPRFSYGELGRYIFHGVGEVPPCCAQE